MDLTKTKKKYIIMKSIFLNIFTISTLLAGIFSITSKNPVVSVLFLITTFVFAACYLLVNGINFIALSYIIVYVGAIAILFLFVVMMINIKITDTLETGNQYTKILPLGLTIVTFFI
jgi:NADH-ubiquinone oxidoreductase chain 6